jgi:hypothetical protein
LLNTPRSGAAPGPGPAAAAARVSSGAPVSPSPLAELSHTPTPLSLPPQQLHANTSSSNVRRSNPAQSSCGGLLLGCSTAPGSAAATCAWLCSGPGWACCPGRTHGPSFAPGAKSPCYLVRFTRGGGIRLAVRRNSSSPVKYKCVVPSGSGRFILQAMRPSSARLKRQSASAPRAPYRHSRLGPAGRPRAVSPLL